jgi:DNA-3-methyladenine glycosylase II
MLGVESDMRAFHRDAARVPWLREFARRIRGVKPPRYPTLWEACVNAIVFQQISLFAAGAIVRRMVEALGERVEFEDLTLHAFPTIESVAECDEAALRGFGLSTGKSTTLRRVGDALLAGSLDETMLASRTSSEAATLLCEIKGIGPWTATVILLRGLGRLDMFPMKDSGIARSAKTFSDEPVDIEEALLALGDQKGMLYYTLLLARLAAAGEIVL